MRGLRVCVVVKRSSYSQFVDDEEDPRVMELLRAHDPTVHRMVQAHEDHGSTVKEVEEALSSLGAIVTVLPGPRPQPLPPSDLVITVGGDGTLLAVSHEVGPTTPVLGVNSAPDHSVGFFCAARRGDVRQVLDQALQGTLERTQLCRMRVERNGTLLHNRVLNEALFCHACPAATSRYILEIPQEDGSFYTEEQRSSGLWIGPPAGSTAAQRSAGGHVLPLTERKLQFVVREPYVPEGGELRFRVGLIEDRYPLRVRSKMRQARLFLDGHHIQHEVTIGDILEMRCSDEPLTVLGLKRNGAEALP